MSELLKLHKCLVGCQTVRNLAFFASKGPNLFASWDCGCIGECLKEIFTMRKGLAQEVWKLNNSRHISRRIFSLQQLIQSGKDAASGLVKFKWWVAKTFQYQDVTFWVYAKDLMTTSARFFLHHKWKPQIILVFCMKIKHLAPWMYWEQHF